MACKAVHNDKALGFPPSSWFAGQDSLLAVLSIVLVSSPSAHSEDISHSVLSGVIYRNAMLHHVGAPFSCPIAPVTYMWRPSHQQYVGVDGDNNTDGCDKPQKINNCSSSRQLWVWIHAASFREGHNALKFACQKQMDETGILISCISLEGQLAKLEVMGSRTCHLLQMMLHPVTCILENSWQLKKCSVVEADGETRLKNFSIFDSEDHTSSSAIISLKVIDPRALTEKRVAVAPEAKSSSILGHVRNDEINGHMNLADNPNKKSELHSSLWSKPEEISDLSECIDLWDVSNGFDPPVEESVLCMEKQHQQLDFFRLGNKNLGAANVSSKGRCSRFCPIMLLKNDNQKGSVIRWSVILPLSWVKAFWVPLVSHGAHAIGLREKHWIACEGGLPYFPSDFPDCRAYSCFMATEAAAADKKEKLRPPAVRCFNVPIPPPWDCVRFAFDKKSSTLGDAQSHFEELYAKNTVDCNSFTKSDCENCETAALGSHVVSSFEGFVVRTSYMLSEFLNNINGEHLLLFPNMPDGKKRISKFMKDEGKLSCQNRAISLLNYDNKLCFLRVLLHAYKKGVFEEGAVVCAPHLTDITLWMSRSGSNDGEILLPQSSLRSFFVQQPSGKWELQIPDDPVARESHRWPIGFVTTGFVRGSKKPVAGAMCEAVCLARLREEQWNSMPVKQRRMEIFVLVRNLRSTAYRLALATIVLERWDEDLEYV
ncbi:ribonucleases P/MRP protein subunit POP1 isoform X2 [Cornus florida]|uniref:ribonucleases P/MRP protein subunit POP1 isoform X2 n=1 Tax=Cornus florida TaxID=4283 RepID=UPI0028A157AD|nr:ribonucleases P/MRP protein subunit POP1 isoform X2 [Cornus florida]